MKRAPLYALVVGTLTACGSVSEVRQNIETQIPKLNQDFDTGSHAAEPRSRVREIEGARIPVRKVQLSMQSSDWLKAKRTDFFNAPVPTPISAIIASLAARGINIVSDLPLDAYTYTGSISSTDAETSLRIVLGSAGLDYAVDDARHIVTIKPLPTKTWTLNIGKRKSAFATGQNAGSGQNASSMANTSGSNQSGTGTSSTTGSQTSTASTSGTQSTSGQTGQGASSTSGTGSGTGAISGGNGVTTDDDFWTELNLEMAKRMKVPLPKARARGHTSAAGTFPTEIPGMQFAGAVTPQPGTSVANAVGDSSASSDLYEMTKIGDYSLNPVTGAIRVQAPHWLLGEIDEYIHQIQEMYDSVISYEGMLVFVNQTNDNSEGLDFQQFASWASGRYGAVISNSALGGVSVNFSQGNIPAVTAPSQTIAGPLLGIVSAKDGLSAFNAYMKGTGNYAEKQRIKVQTSSGVPGSMSTLEPTPFQVVNQSATVGNVGAAAQATNYTMQYMYFGTVMRVSPRYDLATGKVRGLIEVHNSIHSGDKSFPQSFSIGSTTTQITETIPLGKDMDISSETQMRSGDLILLGGQTIDSQQTTESGLPTDGAPLGGLLGTKQSTTQKGTYYFLLQMTVSKR